MGTAAHLEDVVLGDLIAGLAHSHDGRLVHEVHQLGACEAGSGASHLVEVDVVLQLLVSCVHLQDADAALHTVVSVCE